ncbi:hypothetical protein [Ascidiaceihabitans sp.]|uniref:hypothetical protein n=1 Tax=Ascidiaceihabitans sp. TaxID=1872644 RepID=UPI003298A420
MNDRRSSAQNYWTLCTLLLSAVFLFFLWSFVDGLIFFIAMFVVPIVAAILGMGAYLIALSTERDTAAIAYVAIATILIGVLGANLSNIDRHLVQSSQDRKRATLARHAESFEYTHYVYQDSVRYYSRPKIENLYGNRVLNFGHCVQVTNSRVNSVSPVFSEIVIRGNPVEAWYVHSGLRRLKDGQRCSEASQLLR